MNYYCLQCKKGSFYFANKCYSEKQACQKDSHPYSYDRADDFVGCQPKLDFVENCALYSESGVCVACKSGFQIDDDGVCETKSVPNVTNCLYYSENGCIICSTYTNVVATCGASTLTNCTFINPFGECDRCDLGFQLIDAATCTDTDPNCSFYDENQTCQCCDSGFSMINGTCQSATVITGCRCHVGNQCRACLP